MLDPVRGDLTRLDQRLTGEAAAVEAHRAEGDALVERDEAKAAARTATEREAEQQKRADGLFALFQEANKINAEHAGAIGELTGARNELTTQITRLAEKVPELEARLERERAAAKTEAEEAATAAQRKLDELHEAHAAALEAQRT